MGGDDDDEALLDCAERGRSNGGCCEGVLPRELGADWGVGDADATYNTVSSRSWEASSADCLMPVRHSGQLSSPSFRVHVFFCSALLQK